MNINSNEDIIKCQMCEKEFQDEYKERCSKMSLEQLQAEMKRNIGRLLRKLDFDQFVSISEEFNDSLKERIEAGKNKANEIALTSVTKISS